MRKNWGKFLLPVCMLVFLFLLSWRNIGLTEGPAESFLKGETSFSDFTRAVHGAYISDHMQGKDAFVDLNGLVARLSGRRICNNVIRLNNGMLCLNESVLAVDGAAEGIARFSGFVEEQGGEFLYVQAPFKMDLKGELLPRGLTYNPNVSADQVLLELDRNGVDTLDLRPFVSATPELVSRYFLFTDHHWNYTGAFVGFRQIMEELARRYPDRGIDLSLTNLERWESHTVEGRFLGSAGRRVGALFAGMDDFTYYTPRFETEQSHAVPSQGRFTQGSFQEAILWQEYLENEEEFRKGAYSLSLGTDYSLSQLRNGGASSDLKLLILKDSFSLPLVGYLSTAFQEIDVIDPRIFGESTVAEFVAWTRPDVVLLVANPRALYEECYYSFGIEDYERERKDLGEPETALAHETIRLEPGESGSSCLSVPLEPNREYTLTLGDVAVTQGETGGAEVSLYDINEMAYRARRIFDIGYCREKGDFRWTFRTPDTGHEMQLLFYAGVSGKTRDCGVAYRDVELVSREFK